MIVQKMIHTSQTLIQQIHTQPFNRELAEGSLPKQKFLFYLVQDALYLADYSRALALTAARLPNTTHVQTFIQFALAAIKDERDLHNHYLSKYPITRTTQEQNPACFMYTNYLLRMASLASVEEAVASLLPCFYIYHVVGKKMVSEQVLNNPYQDWISLYSSPEFEASVILAMEITNALGNQAHTVQKEAMIKAFFRAAQLEAAFWQAAYAEEQWCIPEALMV